MGRDRKIEDIGLIIDAGLAIVENSGVEMLSTRKVTAQLKISPMTLYNYVENRDALLKLLIQRGFEKLWEGLKEKQDYCFATDNPLRVYLVLADHMLQFGLQHPNLYRFIFSPDITPLLQDETIAQQYRSISSTLLARIKDPQREKEVLDDIYMFQVLINALIRSLLEKRVGMTMERYPILVKRAYDSLLLRDERFIE